VSAAAPRTLELSPEIDELIAHLRSGPVILQAEGRAVAVILGLDEYKDLQAIYEWHSTVLQERDAS
jgi:hypothetical protein